MPIDRTLFFDQFQLETCEIPWVDSSSIFLLPWVLCLEVYVKTHPSRGFRSSSLRPKRRSKPTVARRKPPSLRRFRSVPRGIRAADARAIGRPAAHRRHSAIAGAPGSGGFQLDMGSTLAYMVPTGLHGRSGLYMALRLATRVTRSSWPWLTP